jgi:hypothetical protein
MLAKSTVLGQERGVVLDSDAGDLEVHAADADFGWSSLRLSAANFFSS